MGKLKEYLKSAYSYESRAGHGKEELNTELLGSVQVSENKAYEVYKDTEGNYWYKTKFIKDGEIISDEEYIFGKRKKRRRYYDKNRLYTTAYGRSRENEQRRYSQNVP